MTEQEKNMTPEQIIDSLKSMTLSTSSMLFTRGRGANANEFVGGLKQIRNELKKIHDKHNSFSHGTAYVAIGEALEYIDYLKEVIRGIEETIQVSKSRGNL